MHKGRRITLLLLIVLLFVLIEIGVFLISNDFKEFILTSIFVIFDVIIIVVAFLAIWSECQL